jgi:hypothetical protein
MKFIEKRKNLEKVMKQDIHNGKNGYSIRSLYFDTLNDNDFEEKEDGIKSRKKIRLRSYGTDLDFAMIEMKQKDGDFQIKKSLKLSKEDSIQLIRENYKVLLKYNEPFALELYTIMQIQCYRPKSVVEYNRKAYIEETNQIRITFDSNIKVSETNFNIFDKNLVLNDLLDIPKAILEVKYNRFLLSYIKDFLTQVDKKEVSISKYCLSRSSTKYYTYL